MRRVEKHLSTLFLVLLLLFVVAALSACSQLQVQQEQLDPKIYYNHDLEFNVNGVEAIGTYVAPSDAVVYAIRIEDRKNVDQVQISTCKRTEVVKKESGGIFKHKAGFSYVYVPGIMEKERECRIELYGLDPNNEKSAFGSIFFASADYKLVAGISCNATPDYSATGTAVCEAGKGQFMQIWFQEPVMISSGDKQPDACNQPKETAVSFQIRLAPRECVYTFKAIKSKEKFILTTFGDEQILIRGD